MLGPSWLKYYVDSGNVLTVRLSVFLYVKKLIRGSSPLDEDNSNDPFTAKRIVSLPAFVDNAFIISRRKSSHAPN